MVLKRMNKKGDSQTGSTLTNLLIALAVLALLLLALWLGYRYYGTSISNLSSTQISNAVTNCRLSLATAPNNDFCATLRAGSEDGKTLITCTTSEVAKDLGQNVDCSNYKDEIIANCKAKTGSFSIKLGATTTKITKAEDCDKLAA